MGGRKRIAREREVTQPNFSVKSNAIPATDYDKMSDAEIERLINSAHQVKTGRMGRITTAPPPTQKRYVDLDRVIERYGGQK